MIFNNIVNWLFLMSFNFLHWFWNLFKLFLDLLFGFFDNITNLISSSFFFDYFCHNFLTIQCLMSFQIYFCMVNLVVFFISVRPSFGRSSTRSLIFLNLSKSEVLVVKFNQNIRCLVFSTSLKIVLIFVIIFICAFILFWRCLLSFFFVTSIFMLLIVFMIIVVLISIFPFSGGILCTLVWFLLKLRLGSKEKVVDLVKFTIEYLTC